MKRIAFFISLLLVMTLTACDPAPAVKVQYIFPSASSSVQASEPSPTSSAPVITNTPEPSQSGENVNLTDKQKHEIDALLTGALNMSGNGNATFFQDADSLTASDLLGFVYVVLNDMSDSVGEPTIQDSKELKINTVKKIIGSAFSVDYKPRKGDNAGEALMYTGSSFTLNPGDDALISARPYSITLQPSGSILFKFDMMGDNVPGTNYKGKGEAVLQEDANSLFEYRLISLTKGDGPDISITGAETSSSLPANGSGTYSAANAIDGNDSTAWVTKEGKGEWIKLSFDKPYDLTGLILHFGDWSSEDVFHEHAMPSSCHIDFSDGSSLEDNCYTLELGDDTCFTFGKVINTSYVKITITDILEGDDGANGGVYVSEIKPF